MNLIKNGIAEIETKSNEIVFNEKKCKRLALRMTSILDFITTRSINLPQTALSSLGICCKKIGLLFDKYVLFDRNLALELLANGTDVSSFSAINSRIKNVVVSLKCEADLNIFNGQDDYTDQSNDIAFLISKKNMIVNYAMQGQPPEKKQEYQDQFIAMLTIEQTQQGNLTRVY